MARNIGVTGSLHSSSCKVAQCRTAVSLKQINFTFELAMLKGRNISTIFLCEL
jgi:hypothetical protein